MSVDTKHKDSVPQGGIEKYNEVQRAISEMASDIHQFYGKGNKAAGTRCRVALQKLKGLAQELRVDIQETKKGLVLV